LEHNAPEVGLDANGRSSPEELRIARERFLADTLALTLLEAIPELAMVLNPSRQIIAVNTPVLAALGMDSAEDLVGRRPGELLECVHADDGPDGCGTGPSCDVCGAFLAIEECLRSRGPAVRECRLRSRTRGEGGALDLEVHARHVDAPGGRYAVVAMRDISAEKRRSVLERTFFHDVLNIASGLQAVAQLMNDDPVGEEEYRRDLLLMAGQIADEIQAQRQLLAAEHDELRLDVSDVSASETLQYVADLYRNQTVGWERNIETAADSGLRLATDAVMLRRVLGNLLKNALEATPSGGSVRMEARPDGESVVFSVHNAGTMPPDVQKQVFQRSFSTKGGSGRGIGTHSVKLLTERYLGGQASFTSAEPDGTTFVVRLPRSIA
jgi:signal transduction histidine kinase